MKLPKTRRPTPARIAGEHRRPRRDLLATTALQATAFILLAFPAANLAKAQPAATARPTGGAVVAGGASIAQTTAQTTVQQSTQRAAIDWRSFDVGSGHTVQYNQPNASAVVLNRVTGPDPSQIAGRIQANGQVVITNQSGVTFFRGSQVDVQSLVVSSAGVTNQNFMAGKMIFDQGGKPDAKITNAGNITVAATGLAALVAPQVANSGVINAKMGRVVLQGAEAHTVDLYGDGLMSVDVTRQVQKAPNGATALVTNTGTIIADGGTIALSAKAADGIMTNLVTNTGRLQANTANGRTGTIVMSAVGGTVSIEGTVTANGRTPEAPGGTIVATATDTVAIGPTARISASGRAGGGTIALGTTAARAQAQGGGIPTDAARQVTVAAGARIAANGRGTGSGGTIALLSTENTTMAGNISVRGGRTGGDGGRAEISGKAGLKITGTVDARAPKGKIGILTIDPTDLTIGDTTDVGTAADASQNISATTFNTMLTNAEVNLAATNSITTQTSEAMPTPLVGTQKLSLSAPTITINLGVTTVGDIVLGTAGTTNNVTVNQTVASRGGTATLIGGTAVNVNAGLAATVVLLTTGTAGTIAINAPITATAGVTLVGGSVNQAPAGIIVASALEGTVNGDFNLGAANNRVAALGNITTTASAGNTGAFSFNNTVNLTVKGAVTAAGVINIGNQTPGTSLDIKGNMSGSGIIVAAPTLTVRQLSTLSTSGNATIITTGDMLVSGSVIATGAVGVISLSATGNNPNTTTPGTPGTPGTLAISGTVSGPTLNLAATGVVSQVAVIPGAGSSINGKTSLDIKAGTGISQSGGDLATPTLTASTTTGDIVLGKSATAPTATASVTTLGTTSAGNITSGVTTLGKITLSNNRALTIAGAVNTTGDATISSTGDMLVSGSVVSTNPAGVISLSATGNNPNTTTPGTPGTPGTLAISGTVSGPTLNLAATGVVSQVAVIPGAGSSINGKTSLDIKAGTGISQSGGDLATPTLTASTTTGDIVLGKSATAPTATASVATLRTTSAGNITSGVTTLGKITLSNNRALTIAGAVNTTGDATISSTGDMLVSGSVVSTNPAGVISLSATGNNPNTTTPGTPGTPGTLAISGTVSGPTLNLAAAGVVSQVAGIPGAGSSINGTTSLDIKAGTGISQSGGDLATATLTAGTKAGDIVLGTSATAPTATASVTTLGTTSAGNITSGVTTLGKITLSNNRALTIAGAVNTTGDATISSTGDMLVSGSVVSTNPAGVISLSATGNNPNTTTPGTPGTLAISGTVSGPTLNLAATGVVSQVAVIPGAGSSINGKTSLDIKAGTGISQSGGDLATPTLTASTTTGDIVLGKSATAPTATASVATLRTTSAGNITSGVTTLGKITLSNNRALTIAGAVNTTGDATISSTGDMLVSGSVVSTNPAGVISLSATGNNPNTTTPGTPGTPGTLAISGTVSGPTLNLAAAGVVSQVAGIPGAGSSINGTTSLDIKAGTGISQSGGDLATATLTAGTKAGDIVLGTSATAPTATASVTTLGTTSAGNITSGVTTLGKITLSNNRALTIAGAVNTTGDATISSTGDMLVSGSVVSTNPAGVISLSATGNNPNTTTPGTPGTPGTLAISGTVSGPTLNLAAAGVVSQVAGIPGAGSSINGTTSLDIKAGTGISQSGGDLATRTLTASTPTGDAIIGSPAGPAIASVATLGNTAIAAGTLTLFDNRNLTIAGAVTAGTIASITTAGDMAIPGSVAAPAVNLTATAGTLPAPSPGTIALSGSATGGNVNLKAAANINLSGTASSTNITTLNAGADIAQTNGTIAGTTAVDLVAGRLVVQSGGVLTGGTLTGQGTSISLDRPGNALTTIGGTNPTTGTIGLTATTGDLSVKDSVDLAITGPVKAAAGKVTIDNAGRTLTINTVPAPATATITGNNVALTANAMVVSGTIGACVVAGAGGDVTLNATAGAIAINGSATIGAQRIITATALGGITVAGTLNAPTLTLSNSLAVSSGNVLANILTLTGPLAVSGGTVQANTLSASSISVGNGNLLAASITSGQPISLTPFFGGTIASNSSLNLQAGGSLTSSGTAITTGNLTLTTGGNFTQTGGTFAGSNTSLNINGVANQTAGTLAANGTLLVFGTGASPSSFAGTLAADTIRLIETAAPLTTTATIKGAATVSLGSTTLAYTCPGCTTAITQSFRTLPALPLPTSPQPTLLRIDATSIALPTTSPTIRAGTIELHSINDTTAAAQLIASKLTGTAGYNPTIPASFTVLPTYTTLSNTTASTGTGTATFSNITNDITRIAPIDASTTTAYEARNTFSFSGTPTTSAGLTLEGTLHAGLAAINPPTAPLPLQATNPNAAPLTITLAGPNGALAIGSVTAPATLAGSTVTLNTSQGVTETTASQLVATTLTGTAGNTVSLPGNAAFPPGSNQVATLGNYTVTKGDFTLGNSRDLAITGTVTAPIDTTIPGGNITINAATGAAGSASIAESTNNAAITLAASGIITGRTVTISANSMTLQGQIGACDIPFAAPSTGIPGTITLTTSGIIAINGSATVGAQRSITATALGGITVAGTLNAPTLTLGNNLAINNGLVFGNAVTVIGSTSLNGGTFHANTLTSGPVAFNGGDLYTGNDLSITAPANLTGQIVSGRNLNVSGAAITSTATLLAGNDLTITASGTLRQTSGTFGGASSVTLSAGGVFDQSAAALITSGGQIRATASGTGAAAILGTLAGPTIQISEQGVALSASPTLTGAGSVTIGALTNMFHCPGCDTNTARSTTNPTAGAGTATPTNLRIDGQSLTLGALAATNVELHSVANTNAGAITATSLTGTAGYGVSGIGANGLPAFVPGAANAGTGSATLAASNAVIRIDGYVTRSGLTFNDTIPLTLGGTIRAGLVTDPTGPAMINAAPVTITVNGALAIGDAAAPNTLLAGSAVTLTTTGAITQQTTSTIAATGLSGSAPTVNLPGTNQIGALTGFTAPGGFQLNDGITALTISAPLNIGAATLNLVAGSLTQTTAGVITAGLLTGSTTGTTDLTKAPNAIATLGPFTNTAGNASLTSSIALTIVGALNAGTNTLTLNAPNLTQSAAGIITAGTLSGTVTGTTDLTQANAGNVIANLGPFTNRNGSFALNDGTRALTISGPLDIGAGTLNLVAGSLTQTTAGVITAGLLTGSTTGTTDLTLASNGNAIATAGPFTTGGNFSLTDNTALGVVGALNAGTNTVTLNAASLTQTAAGIVTAGTLGGTIAGNTNLSTANNAITNLGPFTNTNGSFALNNGTLALTITGPLNAGVNAVSLLAGSVSQTASGKLTAGVLTGTITGATDLGKTANAVTNLGSYSSGGNFTLADGGASVTLLGPLNAGANTVALAVGTLSQTDRGVITAATLTADATGSINLGTASNQIATLAKVTAGGNVSLNDGATALNITGPVAIGANTLSLTAGTLSQTDRGVITAGTLTGTTTGKTDLGAATNAIVNLGPYTSGDFRLNDGSQALTITGALNVGTGTASISAGSLTQTANGLITAGTLTGDTTGNTILTLTNNAISTLDRFIAGSRFTLANAPDLTVTGTVQAAGTAPNIQITNDGNLTIDGGSLAAPTIELKITGALTERNDGRINATTLTASAAQIDAPTASNTIAALASISGTRGVNIIDAASLTVTGPVKSAAGDVTLASAAALTVSGSIDATGAVALKAGTVLSVAAASGNNAGTVAAGTSARLTAGTALTQAGTITAGTDATLTAGATLTQSGKVSTGNAASLTAADSLTQSGTITAGTAISLSTKTTAALSGTESAPRLEVIAPNVVLDGGQITVGGVLQPSGTSAKALPEFDAKTAGAFFEAGSNFTQTRSTTVNLRSGFAQATFRIDLTQGTGTATFASLTAKEANLILNLGRGSASGNITVRNLFVIFPGNAFSDGPGIVNLNGTVGGQTGTAAATTSQISPAPSRNYTLNSCAIASVNCVVLRPQAVPVTNPLKELSLNFFREQDDDSELVVPNISEQGL